MVHKSYGAFNVTVSAMLLLLLLQVSELEEEAMDMIHPDSDGQAGEAG